MSQSVGTSLPNGILTSPRCSSSSRMWMARPCGTSSGSMSAPGASGQQVWSACAASGWRSPWWADGWWRSTVWRGGSVRRRPCTLTRTSAQLPAVLSSLATWPLRIFAIATGDERSMISFQGEIPFDTLSRNLIGYDLMMSGCLRHRRVSLSCRELPRSDDGRAVPRPGYGVALLARRSSSSLRRSASHIFTSDWRVTPYSLA